MTTRTVTTRTVCHEIHELLARTIDARWNTKDGKDPMIGDNKKELRTWLRTAGPLAKEATDEQLKKALMSCGYRMLPHGSRLKIDS